MKEPNHLLEYLPVDCSDAIARVEVWLKIFKIGKHSTQLKALLSHHDLPQWGDMSLEHFMQLEGVFSEAWNAYSRETLICLQCALCRMDKLGVDWSNPYLKTWARQRQVRISALTLDQVHALEEMLDNLELAA